MASFDIYCYERTGSFFKERPLLERKTLVVDARVWLDGIDGFYDQYFEGIRKSRKENIRFVVLRNGISSIPLDHNSFERLPFVEARITKNHETFAEVILTSVQPLGDYARNANLSVEDDLKCLADKLRPSSDLLLEASNSGHALWVSNAKYWKALDEKSAIYVFKHRRETRCIVLTTNAIRSYLVRASYCPSE